MAGEIVVGATVRIWPRPVDNAPPDSVLIGRVREVSQRRRMLVVVFRDRSTRRVTFDEVESVLNAGV